MSVDPSALSVAARALRADLAPKLGLTQQQVLIGTPSAAARELEGDSSNAQDVLNLFFYRAEYDGFADGTARDPTYWRAYCLFTAFSVTDPGENGASAGEKDLRLVGGIMHFLHERPFLSLKNGADEVALLQVVPHSLSVDDINHVWATQGELPYRLSIAYELALLPAPLATPTDARPRVGSLALGVGTVAAPAAATRSEFRVPKARAAASDPAWSPILRLVGQSGNLLFASSLSTADPPESVRVVGAGAPGTRVSLVWERWDREIGWRELTVAPESLDLETDSLDPDAPPRATSVRLPTRERCQLQLTARRSWRRPDGTEVALPSNPVLISLYDEGAS
jgi:hypothetical protein